MKKVNVNVKIVCLNHFAFALIAENANVNLEIVYLNHCCCLNCRDCQIECKKNNCCSGSDSGAKLNSCGNLCIKKRYSCEILLPNQEIKYFIFYNSCSFSCNCGKCLRKSCGLTLLLMT